MAEHLQLQWQHAQAGWADSSNGTKVAISAAGAAAIALGLSFIFPKSDRPKPATSKLSGGGIASDRVKSEFDDYSSAYDKGCITDRSRTTQLVDTFYNLVTGAPLILFPCLMQQGSLSTAGLHLQCNSSAAHVSWTLLAVCCVLLWITHLRAAERVTGESIHWSLP